MHEMPSQVPAPYRFSGQSRGSDSLSPERSEVRIRLWFLEPSCVEGALTVKFKGTKRKRPMCNASLSFVFRYFGDPFVREPICFAILGDESQQ